MEDLANIFKIAPELAIAAFMFYTLRWGFMRAEPYLVQFLSAINEIKQIGQRMVHVGDGIISHFKSQREWETLFHEEIKEQHNQIMRRFDILDAIYAKILLKEITAKDKDEKDETENRDRP